MSAFLTVHSSFCGMYDMTCSCPANMCFRACIYALECILGCLGEICLPTRRSASSEACAPCTRPDACTCTSDSFGALPIQAIQGDGHRDNASCGRFLPLSIQICDHSRTGSQALNDRDLRTQECGISDLNEDRRQPLASSGRRSTGVRAVAYLSKQIDRILELCFQSKASKYLSSERELVSSQKDWAAAVVPPLSVPFSFAHILCDRYGSGAGPGASKSRLLYMHDHAYTMNACMERFDLFSCRGPLSCL